jgi:2-alkyl-3-oxoalkanoate reductase
VTGRILVTGASGLLGGVLARRLVDQGHKILPTGRRRMPAEAFGTSYKACDLSEEPVVRSLTAGENFAAVIHSAARIRGDSAEAFVRDNVTATANLLHATRASPLFIYCSTISVYSGDGPFTESSSASATDPYGATKRAGEELCLAHFTKDRTVTVLRLGGLHGHPRPDGIIRRLFDQARSGGEIQLDEPDTVTTLTFLDDVVALVELLLAKPAASGVYNVATSEALSHRQLADDIVARVRSSSRIVSPAKSGARNRVLDTANLRTRLSFAPTALSEHLDRFARGYD